MAFFDVTAKLDKQATENDSENRAGAPVYRYHYALSPAPPREWDHFFDVARAQRPQERTWVAPHSFTENHLVIYCPPLPQQFKQAHDQVLEDVALANRRLKEGIRQEGQVEEAARQGREDERSAVKERLEASWAGLRSEDFR